MDVTTHLCSFFIVFVSGGYLIIAYMTGIGLERIAVYAGIEQCPGNVRNSRNLRQYGSYCYEFVLSHPVDWSHANQDCRRKGGALVDIHSSSENYFIYKTLRELGYLNDEGVWIGLTDVEKENNWHWTRSGSPLDYRNWAPGQPGIVGTFEDCVLLEVKDGKWHDYACSGFLFSSQRHGWVCKYDAESAPMTSSKPLIGSTFYNKLTTRHVDSMSIIPNNGMMTSDSSNMYTEQPIAGNGNAGMMTSDSGNMYSEQPMSGNVNGGMATDGMISKANVQMTNQPMTTDGSDQ